MCFRAIETEYAVLKEPDKNIDQLQGEVKGSVLIWRNVYSQMSSVAFPLSSVMVPSIQPPYSRSHCLCVC